MSTTSPASPTSRVDALMQDYAGHGPGASVLVVRDGEAIVQRSYGFADLEANTPVTPQTNYRLASVSKQFTAAAILLLARDGKLSIDDPVRRWLPSLPASDDAITIRHLLTHTSGLIDYEDLMDPADTSQIHDSGVLALLAKESKHYFAPGTSYRYSNSGYALLSLIVERASGQRYADFLHARIFAPLGMRDTVAYEDGISTVAHRAFGYTFEDGRWQRTDQSTTSAVLGDGGIYSSIVDLQKWDAALYDERLLPRAMWTQAWTPATKTDEADVEYGFGWRITGETVWHSGETVGFRNVIVRWPQRHLTVVVLTNRNDPEPYAMAKQIGALFLDGSAVDASANGDVVSHAR
ncbi:beta-lactamase family protein [Lysobacter sp. A6]|uniref:Beta-lactamase family protein n=1 Tax=Noviluteimonas lactosilytica TaxID=2888523 RepID=A0ABS8JEF9_9GAMM|nr:serine hydrolase domain-containing protein [Lysobacter lactosilyticus]MCC8362000.1 beta-lactamase family protein [Lysobacter lactosilyticus]